MEIMPCPHRERAARRAAKNVVEPYPIWSVSCDSCCRRALAFYPEHELAGMGMALVVGMKRGFDFVTRVQSEQRYG